jgi:hypothetical protein
MKRARRLAWCSSFVIGNTKGFLGAAILGVGGDEAVHCILGLMSAKAPYALLQRAVHIRSTVAEFIPVLVRP